MQQKYSFTTYNENNKSTMQEIFLSCQDDNSNMCQ